MKTLFCADAVFTADGGDHELQEQAAVLVSADGRIEAVGPSKVLRKESQRSHRFRCSPARFDRCAHPPLLVGESRPLC